MQLLERLRQHARDRPDAPALCEVGADGSVTDTLSWRAYAQAVDRVAWQLDQCTARGSVIGVQLANQLTYPVVYLAVLAAGRTVFPLHPALTEYEVQEAAAKANADRVICEQALGLTRTTIAPHVVRAWMQDPINKGDRRKPSGTGAGSMLLQSSGTTGMPKIAERSAGSIDAVARNVARAVGLDQQDQVIAAIPLCHSYGIENGLVGPLLAGACVYACPGFDPGVISGLWSSLDRVVVPAVPIMIDLLASAEDLPLPGDRLRRVYSAGAALPASVSDRFLERFGKRVGQLYGATEIGSVTFGHADASALAPGCVGEAMDGVSIRVVDLDQPAITLPPGEQGQVAIRAPSMLDRYLGDEELPIVAGHYLTGDLGTLGPDGALSITGRIKALIEVGGMKVNAMEVERVLAEHPGVNECVVVPVRITETLSRLTAFVLPVDPDAPPPTASLRRHARGRLAAYKVPRAFEVVDQLPRSSLGKVQRRRLMETRA